MKMGHLISKRRSIHLAVPGANEHFYAMKISLTHTQSSKNATSNLSDRFYQDLKVWSSLCIDMTTLPTYLAYLVHRDTSNIGYTNAYGQGAGGVWIDPNKVGINFVW